MRLLNVGTRKLQEFFVKVPRYVILSHTWGDDEVTFQDLDRPDHTRKRGYVKIDGLCCLAARMGFQWVWVDTCCIDKTSSAELSEAINSMYRWYEDSQICYVYLEDVETGDDPSSFDSQFSNSRWFTRGWTLQELLAPRIVVFFDAAWKELGTRSSLAPKVEPITSIPAKFLEKNNVSSAIRSAKIAMRMSWAARRQTTRVEDRAYSLLGIFDINMPLLYGEGERAFERLQIEIMKQSSDDSILAWMEKSLKGRAFETIKITNMIIEVVEQPINGLTLELTRKVKEKGALKRQQIKMMKQPCDNSMSSWTWKGEGKPRPVNPLDDDHSMCCDRGALQGVLARCPDDFVWWISTQAMDFYERSNSSTEMTTRGLRVTLPILKGQGKISYGVLNCMVDNNVDQILAVRLHHTTVADEYQRKLDGLVTLSWQDVTKCQQRTVYFLNSKQHHLPNRKSPWGNTSPNTTIRIQGSDDGAERLVGVAPEHSYRKEWSCVQYSRNEMWPQILLLYKKIPTIDKKDSGSDGYGFIVVVEERSALCAFFSLDPKPPPFVCYTVPMPKGDKLEQLISDNQQELLFWRISFAKHRHLSKLKNTLFLKAGVPQVKIERENFLDQESFSIKISYTKSLVQYATSIARSITNLRPSMESQWAHVLHRRALLLMGETFVLLIPYVAWYLNSKRRTARWKELVMSEGLVLMNHLLHRIASSALLSFWMTRRPDLTDFYGQIVDLHFAVLVPSSMYTLFPHSRKETKVNPLVSVLCSMAAILLARRGQKVSENLGLESTTDYATDYVTDDATDDTRDDMTDDTIDSEEL
ncbi:HET domain-containing protein [Colletotrichum paranaense]|uniref:HET domain-containing protein n=1 Tax=Colletotrichum paranaense TaxID=1914294 RepID=A0ABQ9T1L1_9PEZI|nr:HET domain-containing protein [Colletotrichum paranaense]KAK1545681.1 HET domain-containing protein [Colletotrichum paranaense]